MWDQSASGELIKGLIARVVLIGLFRMCLAAYENFLTEARNKAQKWSDYEIPLNANLLFIAALTFNPASSPFG